MVPGLDFLGIDWRSLYSPQTVRLLMEGLLLLFLLLLLLLLLLLQLGVPLELKPLKRRARRIPRVESAIGAEGC